MGDPTIGNLNREYPTQVGTSTTWKQISVGYGASAAIKTDGTLWAWGAEYKYWTFAGRSSPTQEIGGGTDWKQVSYGDGQLLAIKANTTLWAYGRSFYGELGTNTWYSGAPAGSVGAETSSFVQIGNSQGWKQVSCGQRHSAAVKYDGTLWTWGKNKYGQLGIELTYPTTIANTSSPAQTIIGGNDWSLVSCGPFNTAAIKQDGSLWIWGSNAYGQVGNGKSALGDNLPEEENVPYPYKVPGQNWRQVICGYHLITALKTDGSLWSWGFNGVGCLGDGTYISKSSPVQISGGNNWKFICGKGSTQILAIKDLLNKPDGYNV